MGVPKLAGVPMTLHPQHVTIRNERGAEMWDLVRDAMDVQPTVSTVSLFWVFLVMDCTIGGNNRTAIVHRGETDPVVMIISATWTKFTFNLVRKGGS